MKKIYSLIVFALMLMPASLFAQTMTEDNAILDQQGYRLEKDVNFRDGFVNGKEIVPNNGLQYSGVAEDYKINGYNPQRLTNEGLEFMSIQLPNNGIDLVNGQGLKSTKNERWIIIHNLRVGQVLAFDISNNDEAQFVANSSACNSGTGWSDTMVDPLIVEEISSEIHSLQEIAEAGSADTYRYYKVINEGSMFAKFNGKSATTIYRMQIWSDKNAVEAVTPPTMKLAGVDGTVRRIAFKPGESTYGNDCTTYWAIVEQGETPLFLKQSDEIDHYDYVYQLDENGQQVLDGEGNPIVVEEIPVYKQVFDEEAVAAAGGEYGDRKFDANDDYIMVDANDDEDGDGFITIQAATVSTTGAFSEVVTLKVSVGEIELNAPTLTLVGMDGLVRKYKVGWTNNTLCEEEYTFNVEYDQDMVEGVSIGDVIEATDFIKVTVIVEGYKDGVLDLQDLMYEGDNYYRANAEAGEHNWNFQTLTEDQMAKINGQIIDHYDLYDSEGNVVKTYTVEQYDNEEIPAEDLGDNLKAVQKYFGWDGPDSRNTARHWRTWIPEYELDPETGEATETILSSVYAADETGLFEGLVVDNDHPKYSTMAIFTDGSGLYFMSRGTIQMPAAKYGEFITLTTNNGTEGVICDNPDGGVSLGVGNGVYVYSIDVFTSDNLPDAIASVRPNKVQDDKVFSVDGRLVGRNGSLGALQRGLYIVNGKKVLVK